MHIQMSSYLPLSITVFLHGIKDILISFSLVQDYIFRGYLIQRRPVHLPMTPWYFRNIMMFLDMEDQALHKIVFAQDRLPLYLSPDCLLPGPPFDEFPVFLLSLGFLSIELPKDPIRGQTHCRYFPSCCSAIAGPFSGIRPVNRPCPYRIYTTYLHTSRRWLSF